MNKNILDTVILNIEGNPWTVRDACSGTIVFGQTGSGKSSGPLYKIANTFLTLGFGGVVFCAKPDECSTWQKYAAEAKRSDDLLLLSQLTFNYLDHEAKRAGIGGGQVENIVNLYLEIVNMGQDKKHGGGTNDEYWQNAVKQMLRNCITVLQMANEPISIQNIYQMIISAPCSNMTGDVEIKPGYCSDLLNVIIPLEYRKTSEYELATAYFFKEFATLDQRTRSNTISSFSVTADAMQRGELHRCFSAEDSSLHLEDIYRKGKILIVDYDQKSWGRLGQYAAAIIKFCFQTMIERREDISDDNALPVFLWADECQFFAIEYDQKFQTTARSSRTLTIYATQNLGNLHDGYGKEKASSLIGNLGSKFFCQNGEHETNKWASESIGQAIVRRRSMNIGDSKSNSLKADSNSKSVSYSEGYSEQKDFRVDPSDFSMLQTGGPRGQCKVGFIFWQSGRTFNTGTVFIRSTIEQQCRRICGAKKVRQCPPAPDVTRGTYMGERKFLLFSDIMVIFFLVVSGLIPCFAYLMLQQGWDSRLLTITESIYLNLSTLLFLFFGAFFNLLITFFLVLPDILHCMRTGAQRKKRKTVSGLVWYDAFLFYMIGCLIMALWLQESLYVSWGQVGIVLLLWGAATILFRFLHVTGKREIED